MTEIKIKIDDYGYVYAETPGGTIYELVADIFGNPYFGKIKLGKEVEAEEDVQPVKWIPVTERLPESYTWVLVSAEDHKVAFDAFYDGAQWKDAVLNDLIVTHWMPLPELPKEET